VLGLGCSRLGSVMANCTRRESLSLIAQRGAVSTPAVSRWV
jgi:hypothetical protein